MLTRIEKLSQIMTSRPIEMAYYTTTSHTTNYSISSSNNVKSKLKCEHCKATKHTRETCLKLVGYPKRWKQKNKGKINSFTDSSHANHSAILENNMIHGKQSYGIEPGLLKQIMHEFFDQMIKGKGIIDSPMGQGTSIELLLVSQVTILILLTLGLLIVEQAHICAFREYYLTHCVEN